MKRIQFFLAVFFLTGGSFAQEPADLAGRVDEAVREFQSSTSAPALTVAVAVEGKLAYSKAFGLADVENEVRATPETLIRTGSIAKPIAAVAVLALADSGKLDVDAPVRKYCPAFPEKPWTVTTRQLLGHTSGIRHYQDGEVENTKRYASMADGLAIFAGEPLLFEPGTRYNYSTYAYTVVGCVAEGASGQQFADYVQEHVLQPAGMTHTFVDDQAAIVPRRARGYSKKDGKLINAGLMDSSYKIPGGGYVSTAEDLVRFELAMMEGRIVKAATVTQMWTSQKTADGTPTGYGLGFFIVDFEDQRLIGHGGSQQGCSTAMEAFPARRYAVAVMVNMDGLNPLSLARRISALYGIPTPKPAKG